MPMHYLALCQLCRIGNFFGDRKNRIIVLLTIALCLVELREYNIFFVQHDLYELPTAKLLNAVNILK